MELSSRVNRLLYQDYQVRSNFNRFPTLKDNSGDSSGDRLEIYSSWRKEDKLQGYDKVFGNVWYRPKLKC